MLIVLTSMTSTVLVTAVEVAETTTEVEPPKTVASTDAVGVVVSVTVMVSVITAPSVVVVVVIVLVVVTTNGSSKLRMKEVVPPICTVSVTKTSTYSKKSN